MPNRREVGAWLEKARADLLAAEVLVAHGSGVLGPAAFHCQQAAEKVLKAYLVLNRVPFKRVHSLVYLLDLCESVDPRFGALSAEAELLAPFAVEVRYPGEPVEPSVADTQTILYAAARVYAFAESLLPASPFGRHEEGLL